MDARPICYLDIGGVVFYTPALMRYKTRLFCDVRPHMLACLKTIHDCGYELRLLTGDQQSGEALLSFLRVCFSAELPHWDLERTPLCHCNPAFNNATGDGRRFHKSLFLDLKTPFIWIEDILTDYDRSFLEARGWMDRFCLVNSLNPDELLRVKAWVRKHPLSREETSEES